MCMYINVYVSECALPKRVLAKHLAATKPTSPQIACRFCLKLSLSLFYYLL